MSGVSADYRADVDGLRTVAVMAVILFHFGLGVQGGFVGVDVFFVVSGFVITLLLRRQISGGEFTVSAFYARRARRILPALLTVVVSSLVIGNWLLLPGDYADLGRSAAYSAIGLANAYFYLNTGYFDQAAELQPLLHLWSLGVEEQFYLVWPILLLAAFRFGRAAVIAMISIVAAASFAVAVEKVSSDPAAAFYLPFGRAWELALGSLAAMSPQVQRRWLAEIMTLIGLVLIATSAFLLTPEVPFPGLAAIPPCLGALLIVWPKIGNSLGAILGSAIMVAIGKRSYSIYLWHWPLFVFYRHYSNGNTLEIPQIAALLFATMALAWLTYWAVEMPARHFKWSNMRWILAGLSGIVGCAVAGGAIAATQGLPFRLPPAALALGSRDIMWDWPCKQREIPPLGSQCVFGAPWETASSHAILWGDSQALMYAPLVDLLAKEAGVGVVLYDTTCAPIVDGKVVEWRRASNPKQSKKCARSWEQGDQFLKGESPPIDTVLLAGLWSERQNELFGESKGRRHRGLQTIRAGFNTHLRRWARAGRRFTILAELPVWHKDPIPCVVAAAGTLLRQECHISDRVISHAQFHERHAKEYEALRSVVQRRDDTSLVLPGEKLCAGDPCMNAIGGSFLYRDQTHLRRNLPLSVMNELIDTLHLREAIGWER